MPSDSFEIIESRTEYADPLPSGLTRKRDGFSRQDVVDAFSHAFEMIGGVQRMALWANANPDKFYPLYSKLLPSTAIQIGDSGAVKVLHVLPPTDLDVHPDPESGAADAVSARQRE
jgi:hypothetical protein